MRLLRTALILSHRYIGIALSLLVAVWFASGIVMMYAGGMPRVAPETRLERLPPLDLSRVKLTLAEAAERAGLDPSLGWNGGRIELLSVMDRPAYRIGGEGSVFADSGEIFEEASLDQSKAIAAGFVNLPLDKIRYERTLSEVDQWTLGQGRAMPQYKFAADDGQGTEIYVQPRAGEVSMVTTTKSRTLAWLGTIPHWLYFTTLRVNQLLWYRIMVWTSAIVCGIAAAGLILGVTQLRWPKPFRLKPAIPYAGWMRWHYISGAIFGVTTLTFAYSGLLSMEPFAWTNATGLAVPRNVFTGAPLALGAFKPFDPPAWNALFNGRAIKEIDFMQIQDEPYYVVRPASLTAVDEKPRERLHEPYSSNVVLAQDKILVSAGTLRIKSEPYSAESILARLKDAVPEAPVVEQTLLSDYDAYYRSRGREAPLPVLRVKFGDPLQTWYYVDPQMSQIVTAVHRLNRLERWLFNGLHDLDFPFLYDKRPLWDIVMIVLCLGGLASSGIGLYLGIKRMRRGTVRGLRAFGKSAGKPAPAE